MVEIIDFKKPFEIDCGFCNQKVAIEASIYKAWKKGTIAGTFCEKCFEEFLSFNEV